MNYSGTEEPRYLEKVTGYFIKARGAHVTTSPKDWLTVEKWESQGIPLKVVYRGLDEAVASLDRSSRLTLGKCDKFVKKNWDSRKALALGKNRNEADDEERHPLDEDYLRAMRYGMPPNGGFGMGVDRLAMVLTDKHSIREALLFPALRKEEKEE